MAYLWDDVRFLGPFVESAHLWNRPICGNRPNCGTQPSCESYIYIFTSEIRLYFILYLGLFHSLTAFYIGTSKAYKYNFLAHLSRRLTGELIVYTGIRRPSVVRPSVRRPSTFSNDISSEAVRRILSILHV